MSEIMILPTNCTKQCENCGDHNKERCNRATPLEDGSVKPCETCKDTGIVNSGHHEYEAAPCPECSCIGKIAITSPFDQVG